MSLDSTEKPPRVHGKAPSAKDLEGGLVQVFKLYDGCSFCGDRDFQVEAETEKEAIREMIKQGVRTVSYGDTIYTMCPTCVELARKNELEY